ncbi:MAG: Uma2 family endonuclease [Chloroflexi bacterium]|nr:Uma2 family endonuclease [Chloroflexota bacterium]
MTPREGERLELIDGELFVSHSPAWQHQYAAGKIHISLGLWSDDRGIGLVVEVPGIVLPGESGVIPDVIWMSWERARASMDATGHFTQAPELVVEILSPGSENIRRDRQVKLSLYARHGVQEYWIVDLARQSVEIYRRAGDQLAMIGTAVDDDVLESPVLLPGFSMAVSWIWPPAL